MGTASICTNDIFDELPSLHATVMKCSSLLPSVLIASLCQRCAEFVFAQALSTSRMARLKWDGNSDALKALCMMDFLRI